MWALTEVKIPIVFDLSEEETALIQAVGPPFVPSSQNITFFGTAQGASWEPSGEKPRTAAVARIEKSVVLRANNFNWGQDLHETIRFDSKIECCQSCMSKLSS